MTEHRNVSLKIDDTDLSGSLNVLVIEGPHFQFENYTDDPAESFEGEGEIRIDDTTRQARYRVTASKRNAIYSTSVAGTFLEDN